MKAKVEAIAGHGINVFVNRQLIYNYPESLLAEKGILTIEHADFEGVERLSLVTGGEIASTFDRPDLVKLGRCDLIEEIIIGEDKVCRAELPELERGLTLNEAYQIFRCGCRRSLYCCVAGVNPPDGGRGRKITTRRPIGTVPDGQGDSHYLGWGVCGNADELCGG